MSDERKPAVLAGFRQRLDPARVREFGDTARRLQRERVEAAEVVEKMLKETPADEWPALAVRAELQTSGALEKLGNTVAQVLGSDPRRALAVAELAVSIAEAIPEDAYQAPILAQLRAYAWKDLGKALLYVGNHLKAIAAFDRAEAQVGGHSALVHDHAIIGYARAAALQEVNRHDESFALLAECKQIFRDHGDTKRVVLCGIAEGVALHRLRRYREARETYLLLLASTRDTMDQESIACLHHAIGHSSVDLGDFDVAEANLSRAVAMFRELDQPLQALKGELGRGRLLVHKGEIDRGIAHLRPVRREFLRHGMIEEAGLAGLEIVEALLRQDRASEAETLARQIITEFTNAGLNTRAITALGYLQEAIAARRASAAMVADIRDYILSLRTSPERELAVMW